MPKGTKATKAASSHHYNPISVISLSATISNLVIFKLSFTQPLPISQILAHFLLIPQFKYNPAVNVHNLLDLPGLPIS